MGAGWPSGRLGARAATEVRLRTPTLLLCVLRLCSFSSLLSAAYLPQGTMEELEQGVILLLGAPGAGKSLLGEALSKRHGASFLNVGQELRSRGLVEPHLQHPTETGRQRLASEARQLAAAACSQLKAGSGPRCGGPGWAGVTSA